MRPTMVDSIDWIINHHEIVAGTNALFGLIERDELSKSCIAIDGPGASGKGSINKILKAITGCGGTLNAGTFYRASAYVLDSLGIAPGDVTPRDIRNLNNHLSYNEDQSFVEYAGREITQELNGARVGEIVANYSNVKDIKSAIFSQQRTIIDSGGYVLDGRDMVKHICPDALFRIYYTASTSARAKRRYKQFQRSGSKCDRSKTFDDVFHDIELRDEQDFGNTDFIFLRPEEAQVEVLSGGNREGEYNIFVDTSGKDVLQSSIEILNKMRGVLVS